ncbi:MAG TPA: alpha/beta hydrolase [Aquabacterium sp.]|uniref:serine aminopeptidase domain-containing protein n=1 Tax=Aquabacterium sp. TaxID=1872578 RepID=UPI002E31C801|nr:alpha/beta hydrolase [Aquabacterium sp.]HEX5355201.1 alpha/beta hydrolase [Aquabacterium sp.]
MFFGASALPLFGCLHAGTGPARDVGVVLCSTWGREEVSAHHSLRQWALQLSQQGWPCLRFDYPGEGDSAGDPLADGGLDAWVGGVRQAIEELKRRTGVTRVCLLGVRAGVALACLAAQGRDDVMGLVAVAPVVKGRGFVRELNALQAAACKTGEPQPLPGVFQSGGYVMTQEARDALSGVDLTALARSAAPQVLVLDRDDMPPSTAWIKALEAQGAVVQQAALPGYVRMMADPHHAVAPQAMIDVSLRWLNELSPVTTSSRTELAPGLAAADEALLPVPQQAVRHVREQALFVQGGPAFGVLTQPAEGQHRTGQAILVLNAGSTRHIGPSRQSVTMARRWAAEGHVVLRIDLAGIGEAGVRAGRELNMSYPHEAMLDVRAALDQLRTQPGVETIHACGLCAGAYHALKAARDGMPLASVTLINPLIFFNAEGLSLEEGADLSPQKVHSAAASYKESAASLEKWLKLFKGQIKFDALFKVMLSRATMVLSAKVKELGRLVHWPLKDDLGTDLRRLAGQGVRVNFIFAQGDPGESMLREQAGSVVHGLQRRGLLSLNVFQGADHVFTDAVVRHDMLMCLAQIMSAMTAVI